MADNEQHGDWGNGEFKPQKDFSPASTRDTGLKRACFEAPRWIGLKGLAFRELEATTGFRTTVFLAFNSPAIAGQEATFFKNAAEFRFKIGQRF